MKTEDSVSKDLIKQVNKEMASLLRLRMVAKTSFALLGSIIAPVLMVFIANDEISKVYFLFGAVIVIISFITFYIFSPKIISKKHQLKKYIAELEEEKDVWKKRIESRVSIKAKILNESALLLEPYPEISRNLEKLIIEAGKLVKNTEIEKNRSLIEIFENYKSLSAGYQQLNQKNELREPLQKVLDLSSQNSNEKFNAVEKFFDNVKNEQKKLPEMASAYKLRILGAYEESIVLYKTEMEKVLAKKNQATLMLKELE